MVLRSSKFRIKTYDELENVERYTKLVKDKMRAYRKANKLNRTDLNNLMSLGDSSGWKTMESRQGVGFTLKTLIRISTVMQISLEELLSSK